LGMVMVNGRNRVPLPPARMTAIMAQDLRAIGLVYRKSCPETSKMLNRCFILSSRKRLVALRGGRT
jgi:hypothetical protein